MAQRQADVDNAGRFLSGDSAQVGEIRDEIQMVVRGFRLPGAGVVEELVQESLARLVSSLREGRFRADSSLKTYARNVAKYVCLEHRRRILTAARLGPEVPPPSPPWPDPEESVLDSEQHRRNLEVFAALPTDSRELLRLIGVEGLSYREVGIRLGITEGAIKSRVRRMRAVILRLLTRRRGRPLPARRVRRSVPQ